MANRTSNRKRGVATKSEKTWNNSNSGFALPPVLPPQPGETITDRLRNIISRVIGEDEDLIGPETLLIEDLGADSLDLMEILIEVEDAFGLSIPDSFEFENVRTLRDWLRVIENPPVAEPEEEVA